MRNQQFACQVCGEKVKKSQLIHHLKTCLDGEGKESTFIEVPPIRMDLWTMATSILTVIAVMSLVTLLSDPITKIWSGFTGFLSWGYSLYTVLFHDKPSAENQAALQAGINWLGKKLGFLKVLEAF